MATILQEAAADGRLELEELDERLGVALRAKTYADLEPLVADLSAHLPWRSGQQTLAPLPVHGPPPPGYSREDPLRLDAGWSSEKREGVWVVPPYLRIDAGMGSVKLNCLQATAAAPVIEVEVNAGTGSVVFIVPDGWAANDDRLGKSMGSKSIKVPAVPAPGHPLLVCYGNVGMGSFKVRPPSPRELRKLGDATRR